MITFSTSQEQTRENTDQGNEHGLVTADDSFRSRSSSSSSEERHRLALSTPLPHQYVADLRGEWESGAARDVGGSERSRSVISFPPPNDRRVF